MKGILSKRPKMTPNSVGGRTQHSGARIANAAATPTDRGPTAVLLLWLLVWLRNVHPPLGLGRPGGR